VFRLQNDPEGTGLALAHSFGLAAQQQVSGFSRESMDLTGLDPATRTGTTVTTQVRGNQTVTVILQWVNGDLVKVTRE
jgi:hypothetical protein